MNIQLPEFQLEFDSEIFDQRMVRAGLHGLCAPLALILSSRLPNSRIISLLGEEGHHLHSMVMWEGMIFDASGRRGTEELEHYFSRWNPSGRFHYQYDYIDFAKAAEYALTDYPRNAFALPRSIIENMANAIEPLIRNMVAISAYRAGLHVHL